MLIMFVAIACASGAAESTRPSSPSAGSLASPASPTASVAASPAAAFDCDEETVGCAGPLTAGQHATAHFERPFTFTVPAGWTNDRDIYRSYTMRAAAGPHAEFIVWTRAAPATQTPDCGPARREGFGTSVAEWLRSLTTDDRLDVTTQESFKLGTRAATRVELKVKGTFKVICEGNTDPFAVIVTDTEIPPTRNHGGGGPMTFASMTLVDFGDDAIVIWNDGGDVSLQQMVGLSLPVIESMRFDT
jgi:hypothetical protein